MQPNVLQEKKDGKMKFVDLSQTPPVEVSVYTLREIASRMPHVNYPYAVSTELQNWHDDPEIDSPTPAFTISEQDYWKPEQVEEWSQLRDKMCELEEIEKSKELEAVSLTKMQILDVVIARAKEVRSLNSGAYSHNRGNSMQDGRKRVLALQGEIRLLDQLLLPQLMPLEKRKELNQIVSEAKSYVKMQ